MLKKTVTAEIKSENLIKEGAEEAKKALKKKSEKSKKESDDDSKVESKSSN